MAVVKTTQIHMWWRLSIGTLRRPQLMAAKNTSPSVSHKNKEK